MPNPPPANEPQWPPRSPREALLSTPGGRERLRRLANRTSPTPSPLRRSQRTDRFADNAVVDVPDDLEDEDEDEETLQLKLQEIQARLRLKKLQNAKTKRVEAQAESEGPRPNITSLSGGNVGDRRPAPSTHDRSPLARPSPQVAVEVPVSPVRKTQPPIVQASPTRVLLGIDKGWKAKDVSLKRAPSLRKNQGTRDEPVGGRTGRYLNRSHSSGTTRAAPVDGETRPLSFNERLAAARTDEMEKRERQERIRRVRTNAFGITQQEVEGYKAKATEIPDEPLLPPEFSRDEVLAGLSKPASGAGVLRRTNTEAALPIQSSRDGHSSGGTNPAIAQPNRAATKSDGKPIDATFEPFSSFHLSRCILPHPVLSRQISGKKTLSIKDVLCKVKAPNYELPDVEQDVVVFAIVAKKSEPRSHKPSSNSNSANDDRTKYMVLTLVDLQLELELFLFNSGFTRYWKIIEGTVIALLNPVIMPPPKSSVHSGRFSLVINSDEDTILEIGIARDLGFCKSIKKDGNPCGSWVNKKRTEFCEYHTNEAVEKQRSKRVELNNMDFGGRRSRNKLDYWTRIENFTEKYMPYKAGSRLEEPQGQWFVSKSRTAAELIDGVADRREREEALKRRLIVKEREQEMMKTLGRVGNGAGREYMRTAEAKPGSAVASSSSQSLGSNLTQGSSSFSSTTEKPDARALGIIAPRGNNPTIHLSPIKRKRPESSHSTSTVRSGSTTTTTNSRSGLGWGTNLKDKLTRMKEGENFQPPTQTTTQPVPTATATATAAPPGHPPVRKRTRFVTEKGIREAGRESLGDELGTAGLGKAIVDDDDDLIILR